ncbi:MAG: TraB/GumN family protein, partial [Acidobacteria bacterium]|nr:TraB/GumN family protein [Acidobacteriota bacterium]
MNTFPDTGDARSGRKRAFPVQVAVLAVFLFWISSARPVPAQSLLWEVKSGTATVYLYGSIHYAKPEMYPLDAAVEDAFGKSSALVLELDPLSVDPMEVLQEVLSKGMYAGDKTIKDELSGEVYAMLEEYLEKAGLPPAAFMKMKPALLSITLSTMKVSELGYSPDQGIDMYFARKAAGKKPILELESAGEQMDMLFNLPDAGLYLKYTLMDISRTGEQIEAIVEAWK